MDHDFRFTYVNARGAEIIGEPANELLGNDMYELDAYPSTRGLAVYFRDVSQQVEREKALERALKIEREASEQLRDLDRARVVIPDELPSHADQVLVERITLNLLENAAKYAPRGTITVHLEPLHGTGFRLEVRDEGPGLPTAELERIFEPFHRVDHDHPQPGTGIGLALVADFARIHDGRAWAENLATGGARFIVEIPAPGQN